MAKTKGGYGFLIKWLIVLGDLLLLNLFFWVISLWIKPCEIDTFNLNELFLLLNFCYLLVIYWVPVQMDTPVMFMDRVVQRSLLLVAFHAILFIACLFILLSLLQYFPIRFLIYYYLGLFFIFPVWRILARKLLKTYRRYGRNYKKVIIVGAGKNGLNLFGEMKKDLAYGFKVYGFFDDNELLKTTLPNYLGMTHEVESFAETHDVDEIYCTLPNSQDEKIMRLLNYSEKHMIRFYLIPEFSRYVKRQLTLESIESLPIMAVRSEPLQSISNQIIKRAFDIVFSLSFLCLIFPFIYLIVGVIIKISSKGTIFFKQKRTGLYGKEFYCYKFRSMRPNKDANLKQAEKGDPRVTRIGQFLRSSNLDELPQFYNVLKGEMSVVGPRPHMLKHTELYSSIIDKYMVRHLIRPGITGWAQVNGYRGETRSIEHMESRVRYDVWYLENWTFFLDLKIIFTTISNMFHGEKNAY
jgi:putative colanic acid biosynthesis UDP-glucose lipid carrier transferase